MGGMERMVSRRVSGNEHRQGGHEEGLEQDFV